MILTILQAAVSVALIVLILLQERSAGMSNLFGGESAGAYQTRRGVERGVFTGTIVLSVVFVALALAQLAI